MFGIILLNCKKQINNLNNLWSRERRPDDHIYYYIYSYGYGYAQWHFSRHSRDCHGDMGMNGHTLYIEETASFLVKIKTCQKDHFSWDFNVKKFFKMWHHGDSHGDSHKDTSVNGYTLYIEETASFFRVTVTVCVTSQWRLNSTIILWIDCVIFVENYFWYDLNLWIKNE